MSLDKGLPGRHLLARAGIMGTPYHGLVREGVLVLPNAESKSYPQPNATQFDTAGSAHLLRRPGQPAVSRSEEEALADAAAGWQWRNVAMLSGSNQQLYGRDIRGWVYIDPDGGRWMLRFVNDLASLNFGIGATFSLTLNIRRFGGFGSDPEARNVTISLADWGQSGYATLQDFPVDSSTPLVNALTPTLDAITPSGDRVALCVARPRTLSSLTSDPTVDVTVRHALGWVEISVSMVDGLPVPTLSVLKTRAQTLMTVEQSTTDASSIATFPPLEPSSGLSLDARVGMAQYTLETLRLVRCWVDPDTGAWRWVALRNRFATERERGVSSAGLVYTIREEQSGEEFIALEVDGVEVARYDSSREGVSEWTLTYTGESAPLAVFQSQVGTEIVVLDGNEFDASTVPGSPDAIDDPGTFVFSVALGYPMRTTNELMQRMFTMQWRHALQFSSIGPWGAYSVFLDVCHQSAQVLTIRVNIRTDTSNNFTYWPRATPSGVFGSKQSRPYAATERLFGSWCPHTGQVASMEGSPVCWV